VRTMAALATPTAIHSACPVLASAKARRPAPAVDPFCRVHPATLSVSAIRLPPPFPSVTFSLAVLFPRCAGAHLAPSWARGAPQVSVVGVRIASAVASSDRKLGERRSHLETKFDRQHVLLSCLSLSQQWACIVITVTNVRGSSAYVRHSDHTVTEVSQSDVPQRS